MIPRVVRADVVVIGGGLSGTMAALAARSRGKSVALVRRALGMTALSSGLLPVAPDPLATADSPRGSRAPLAERVRALVLARPEHPYALLQGSLADALTFASREVPQLKFSQGEVGLYLGPAGGLVPADGALSWLESGDLTRATGVIAVVGLLASPAFDAEVLVRLASDATRRAGFALELRPVQLRFGNPGDRPHILARAIAKDPDAFARHLKDGLPAGTTRILLPPVLDGASLHTVQELRGLPCALWAAAPPSLPGLELQRLLDARLEQAGVQQIAGEAFSRDGEVRVRNPAPRLPPPSLFDAGLPDAPAANPPSSAVEGRIILATGRFVGGGLRREGRLRESVLDLPVWLDGRVDEGRSLLDFTSYELAAEQPAFNAGLKVDATMRPLHRDGSAATVHACGDILGGTDPARDGTWAGVAIASGYVAGLAAAG